MAKNIIIAILIPFALIGAITLFYAYAMNNNYKFYNIMHGNI